MEKLKLKPAAKLAVNLCTILAVGLVAFFLILRLQAYFLEKKVFSSRKPRTKQGRLIYYRKALERLSAAIEKRKGIARLWRHKADYMHNAYKDNLSQKLEINKNDIEKLYLKAVSLNPANYNYHIILGNFYRIFGINKAEKELVVAKKLNPAGVDPYFHLTRFYLKNNQPKQAFFSLLEFFYYEKAQGYWRSVLKGLQKELASRPSLLFQTRRWSLGYSAAGQGYEYDLGKNGFPHIKLPITIRVYLENGRSQLFLYRNFSRYAAFEKVKKDKHFSVFEYKITSYSKNTYLDDFSLKTGDFSPIKKIEFIKYF